MRACKNTANVKTMKLFELFQRTEQEYDYIEKRVILCQKGSFFENYNADVARDLSETFGLALRNTTLYSGKCVGIHFNGLNDWTQKFCAVGFTVIVITEVPPTADERRQKVQRTRVISNIHTASTLTEAKVAVLNLEALTFQLIATGPTPILEPIQSFDSLNALFGDLTKLLMSQNLLEVYTAENDADVITSTLSPHGTVFVHQIKDRPILAKVLSIVDFRGEGKPIAIAVSDEPVARTDILVDSTTFAHLRISEIQKLWSKKLRTSDGFAVLNLLLANPSTDASYLEALATFRTSLEFEFTVWKKSDLLKLARTISKPIVSSVKNIQQLLADLTNLLTLNSMFPSDPQQLAGLMGQWKLKLTPTALNTDAINSVLERLKLLVKEAVFQPTMLMQHWAHVLHQEGLKPLTDKTAKNRFMYKDDKGRIVAHRQTERFEDLWENERLVHLTQVQQKLNSIVAFVSTEQIKTVALTVGLTDVYSHIKTGVYADLHTDEAPSVAFSDLCRITHPDEVKNTRQFDHINILRGSCGSGKSTLARAIATNAYVAQCGLPVQATAYRSHIVDAIALRFGSTDNFKKNLSSFESESQHMSQILKTATSKSLVFIDELGLVCSAEVGLNVCQHVLQELEKIGCVSFFLTHFGKRLERNLKITSTALTMGEIPYTYKIAVDNRLKTSSQSTSVLKMIGFPHSFF